MMELSWYGFRHLRYRYHAYRYAADWKYKLALCWLFAGLIGICAQIKYYPPATPVPVTLQNFGVYLAGIMLGRWALVSTLIYAGAGFAGLPWFAGLSGGLGVLLGPTGGYIIGFVFSGWLLGYHVDRRIVFRRAEVLIPGIIGATLLIYGFGIPHLYAWLVLSKGITPSLGELLYMGAHPGFLGSDTLEAIAAGILGTAALPKACYNGEVDPHRAKERFK